MLLFDRYHKIKEARSRGRAVSALISSAKSEKWNKYWAEVKKEHEAYYASPQYKKDLRRLAEQQSLAKEIADEMKREKYRQETDNDRASFYGAWY